MISHHCCVILVICDSEALSLRMFQSSKRCLIPVTRNSEGSRITSILVIDSLSYFVSAAHISPMFHDELGASKTRITEEMASLKYGWKLHTRSVATSACIMVLDLIRSCYSAHVFLCVQSNASGGMEMHNNRTEKRIHYN